MCIIVVVGHLIVAGEEFAAVVVFGYGAVGNGVVSDDSFRGTFALLAHFGGWVVLL